MLDGVRAQLASEAGLLVAAERHGRVHWTVSIDPDRARLQPARERVRLLDVVRPNARRKTINILVCEFRDLVDVIEAERRQHGAEDLFLGDGHVVVDGAKYRRFNEE